MKACMSVGITMIILWSFAMIFNGCRRQYDAIDAMTKDKPHTVIVPGVLECKGHVEVEYFGTARKTKLPMLVCDDGRVFHNVTNYQDVIELNPLRQ